MFDRLRRRRAAVRQWQGSSPGSRTLDVVVLWKWAVVGRVRRHWRRVPHPRVRNTTDLGVNRARGCGMRHLVVLPDRHRFQSKQRCRSSAVCPVCALLARRQSRRVSESSLGESWRFELVAFVPGIREPAQPEADLGGIATRNHGRWAGPAEGSSRTRVLRDGRERRVSRRGVWRRPWPAGPGRGVTAPPGTTARGWPCPWGRSRSRGTPPAPCRARRRRRHDRRRAR